MVRCKVQGRGPGWSVEFLGGLVQAGERSSKVLEVLEWPGGVWCRRGVWFKEGSGGFGCQRFKVPEVPGWSGKFLVQARCKVHGRFRRFRGGLMQAR